MKKMHILLSTLFLGTIGAAYATCYLTQVVCCIQNGDDTGKSFSYSVTPVGTVVCTGDANYIADEDAYALTTYAVTAGGFGGANTSSTHVACDGFTSIPDPYNLPLSGYLSQGGVGASPSTGNGFLYRFVAHCNGSTYNEPGGTFTGLNYSIGYINGGLGQANTCN